MLIEILKNARLNSDGTLDKDIVEKVNSTLNEFAKGSITPPVMLPGVPSDVKSQFYKTAADFYTTRLGQDYKAVVSKYRTLYEISKKNKI
jgi:hypothetical protein